MPRTTSAVGGTDSALRLVLVLEGNVLERVHLAQVRPAGFEGRPHLGVSQLRAAFRAMLLDDGIDAFAFLEPRHQSCAFVSTWVTGRPVARSALDGRSIFIHLDTRSGSVEMMISSNSAKLFASCTAATGSESPMVPSTLNPSPLNFSSPAARCGSVCSRAASGSAAFSNIPPLAGTTSVY